MQEPAADPGAEQPADLLALGVSLGTAHHALQLTGALCLAAAVAIPGTIPNLLRGAPCAGSSAIRIRHPRGVVVLTADVYQSLRRCSDHNDFWDSTVNATRLMPGCPR